MSDSSEKKNILVQIVGYVDCLTRDISRNILRGIDLATGETVDISMREVVGKDKINAPHRRMDIFDMVNSAHEEAKSKRPVGSTILFCDVKKIEANTYPTRYSAYWSLGTGQSTSIRNPDIHGELRDIDGKLAPIGFAAANVPARVEYVDGQYYIDVLLSKEDLGRIGLESVADSLFDSLGEQAFVEMFFTHKNLGNHAVTIHFKNDKVSIADHVKEILEKGFEFKKAVSGLRIKANESSVEKCSREKYAQSIVCISTSGHGLDTVFECTRAMPTSENPNVFDILNIPEDAAFDSPAGAFPGIQHLARVLTSKSRNALNNWFQKNQTAGVNARLRHGRF